MRRFLDGVEEMLIVSMAAAMVMTVGMLAVLCLAFSVFSCGRIETKGRTK